MTAYPKGDRDMARKKIKQLRPAHCIIDDIMAMYNLTIEDLAQKTSLSLHTLREFHLGPFNLYTSYPTLQKCLTDAFDLPENFFDPEYKSPAKSTGKGNEPKKTRKPRNNSEPDDLLQQFMKRISHKQPEDVKLSVAKARRLAELVKDEFPEIAENIDDALIRWDRFARDIQSYKYCNHSWSVPWEDPNRLKMIGPPIGVDMNDSDAVMHYYMYNFSTCKKCGIPYRIGDSATGLTDADYDACAQLYASDPVISFHMGCHPSLSIVEAYAKAKYGIDFMAH